MPNGIRVGERNGYAPGLGAPTTQSGGPSHADSAGVAPKDTGLILRPLPAIPLSEGASRF